DRAVERGHVHRKWHEPRRPGREPRYQNAGSAAAGSVRGDWNVDRGSAAGNWYAPNTMRSRAARPLTLPCTATEAGTQYFPAAMNVSVPSPRAPAPVLWKRISRGE